MIRFSVLGSLRVERDGNPVPGLNALMVRRLLAALLSRAGDLVPVDELILALWGEDAPQSARKTLQVYVRRLRAALGEDQRIVHEPAGYRIHAATNELDLAKFEELVIAARRDGRTERAVDLLSEALGLWRGAAFEDVREPTPLVEQARRADEERLRVEVERMEIQLELGCHDDAIPHLLTLTQAHPFREDLRGQLMLAFYRAGRQAEALEIYRSTRKLLDEELGIAPGRGLRRLHELILCASPELDLSTLPSSTVPRQLPADVGGFVGRSEQLEALDSMLSGPTPVVISAIAGTAGVGKTALATHWARRVADRFPDGQLYLNLNGFSLSAPVRPIEALASMLRSVGVPSDKVPMEEADAAAFFRSKVATRQMLILLDNARSADHVRPLLPGGPGCLVLVTSRNRLSGLVAREGARRLDLDVLTRSEARDLLVGILGRDRAAAEPSAIGELAQVCAYLPLALRMAAANLNDRPHRTVAKHVDELRSGDRLASLAVDGDERAAVRLAFDLSYQDIDCGLQSTFRMLGLVPGRDFTAEAVAALTGLPCPEAEQHLIRLSNAHLIEQVTQDRYGFHDLLRLYAEERTAAEDSEGDRARATRLLFDWYLERVDAAADLLYPNLLRLPSIVRAKVPSATYREAGEALAWLDDERHNLVGLIGQAAARGLPAMAWLMADGLRGYGTRSMHRSEWLPAALAALDAAVSVSDPQAEASANLGLAHIYRTIGEFPAAIKHLELAIAKSRDAAWEVMESTCLGNLGGLFFELGSTEQALALVRRSLELARSAGDLRGEVGQLNNLGFLYIAMGKLDDASDLLRTARRLHQDLGHVSTEAAALSNLGSALRYLGDFPTAIDSLQAAVDLKVSVGDRYGQASTLGTLAAVYGDAGQLTEGLHCASRSLELAREVGDRSVESEVLATAGAIHMQIGDLSEALSLCVRALEIARGSGGRHPETVALVAVTGALNALKRHDEAERHAREALNLARRCGYRILEGQAVGLLAQIALRKGEQTQAVAFAQEALAGHRSTGHRLGEADMLSLLAELDPPAALKHQQAAAAICAALRASKP